MPMSAFGDPIPDDKAATPQPPAAVPKAQPQLSAFGDSLDDAPDQPAAMPNRTASQWLTDIGGNVGRGAYGLFDSLAGLGDIATGGAATPWLAEHGLDSQKARATLDAEMSPQARAQRQEVQNAQGFFPTLGALLQNPAYAAGQVIESVPTMVAGGVAGKGVALGAKALGAVPKLAGIIGAGSGEGLATAGQQAAQTVQQTGDLTAGQTGLALLSGGLTGLLGAAGARIGRALGVADIDAQLAGSTSVDVAKGLVNRALKGTGIESLEELSQSGQQQVLTNLATDRPALEGVGNAAGQGALLGGVMGGAGGLRRPTTDSQPAPVPMPAQQQQGMPQPAMPSPAPEVSSSPIAPQAAAAPAPPVPKTPFAGSQDISPLLDNLGVQGEQRAKTLDLLRPAEADIEARRRGVVTLDEQRRLADLIGLDGAEAQVFSRKIGQAFNAEQMIATTDLVKDRLSNVLEQQQLIVSGQASDVQKAQFVQDIGELNGVFGELMGARAESGRALAAQRRQIQDIRQAQNILEGIGGVQGADDLAAAIGKAVQAGGIGNASKLIASRKPGLFDYYFRAALLSSPRTHAVNALGNSLTLGNEIVERGIAAGISGAKRAFTGGKAGQTLFAEPLDLLIGMAKGTTQAGVAAADAFRTGESAMLGVGKAESGVGIQPRQGLAEKAFSLPYRALGASDSFFGTLNYEAELRALARQQAVAENKAGTMPTNTKLSQRIEQLTQDPTPNMIEQAGEHARKQTFNQRAGTFAQAIISAKAKAPWLNVLVPFVRTPANIVKYGLKRTPFAPVFKEVRDDIRAGGAKQERALSSILWGSSVMIGAGALAQAGYITGAGPSDDKEKRALLATGWRPYSIKVGDTYHEYNRLDPFAQWLSLASDLATTNYQHKDAGDIAAGLLGSFANATINKTYMQGLSNFSEFLSDPKRNGAWYLRQQAGTLAQPFTMFSSIASENDPYARETNSVLDAIKYRVPGLRQDLPEKLDAFGQPIPNRTYPGGPLSIAAPIAQSQQTTDPVRLELGRLGYSPPVPGKHFTSGKVRHDLDDAQYHELAQLTGQLTESGARRLMRSKEWAGLDDDQKRDALDKLAKKARDAVKVAMLPFLTAGKRDALNRLHNAVQQSEATR